MPPPTPTAAAFLLLLLLLATTLACAGAPPRPQAQAQQATQVERRITQLEREEAKRQVRLAELSEEINAAELELARAQEQTRRASCKAERVKIEAVLAEQTAHCGLQMSGFELCLASNEADTSKKAALGCGLGIVAGVVSGGALAPLALAGCAGGYASGKLTEQQCGRQPTCINHLPQRQAIVGVQVESLAACERGVKADGSPRQPAPRRAPR